MINKVKYGKIDRNNCNNSYNLSQTISKDYNQLLKDKIMRWNFYVTHQSN